MLFSALLMIALGGASILFPLTAGVSVEEFYGLLLTIAAVTHLISLLHSGHGASAMQFLVTIILFVMGALLMLFPIIGLMSLALITGIGFFLQGVVQIASAASAHSGRARYGVALSGIVGVLSGGLILYGWPFDSTWVYGVLLGINLVFLGVSTLTSICLHFSNQIMSMLKIM